MKNNLREYKLISLAAERSVGVYPVINTSGNFFMLRAVRYRPNSATPFVDYTLDCPIKFKFDGDQLTITRRAGEGGNRDYERFECEPIYQTPGDLELTVVAGYGSLYSEREEQAIPSKLNCQHFTINPLSTTFILDNIYGPRGSVREIRLHIPLNQSGDLWLAENGLDAASKGIILAKGVTEYLSFNGYLCAYNPSATDQILLSVGYILRDDF